MKLFCFIITITLLLIIYSVIECDAKGGRSGGRSSGRGSRGHSSYHGSSHKVGRTGYKGGSHNHFKNSFGSRRGGQGFWNSFTSIPFFSRFKIFGGKSKPSKSHSPSPGKDVNNNDINVNSKNDLSKTNSFDDIGKKDISRSNTYDNKPSQSSAGQSSNGYSGFYHSQHYSDSRRRQGHGSETTTAIPMPIETTTSITQWMDEMSKKYQISTSSPFNTKYDFPKINDISHETVTYYPKAISDALEQMKNFKLTPD